VEVQPERCQRALNWGWTRIQHCSLLGCRYEYAAHKTRAQVRAQWRVRSGAGPAWRRDSP